jgi:hypothetical protein
MVYIEADVSHTTALEIVKAGGNNEQLNHRY